MLDKRTTNQYDFDMRDRRVRVRFAPSPTGFLHIGNLRTALYAELLAKNTNGDFLLRIEDTDKARAVPNGVEIICATLEKTGIIPNEGVWVEDGEIVERGGHGPYIQSKRKQKHHEYAHDLIKMDKAYPCFCTDERLKKLREKRQAEKRPTGYDGTCRDLDVKESAKRMASGEPCVIRLRFPQQGSVTVNDVIRGKVAFDWSVIDDQVIIKTDGMPTYHLAATCDDHDMEITHVLRGEEWLPSTPKHLFIYEAFGWEPPIFAHLPLLLNSDKSKLSKRQGDVAVEEYLAKGYLPEALINFVALLGWNPSGDQEVYSHEELAKRFDVAKVNKAGAVFNLDKLNWFNNHYIRELPEDEYVKRVTPYLEANDDAAFIQRAALLVRDRLQTLPEVREETAFLFRPAYDFEDVPLGWKEQEADDVQEKLETVRKLIESLDDEESLHMTAVESKLMALIAERKWQNGETLWPLRVALSGRKKSPGPFELVATYGKKRALQRIDSALAFLAGK